MAFSLISPLRQPADRLDAARVRRAKDPPDTAGPRLFRLRVAAKSFRKILGEAQTVQSMSRKGNCWDSEYMEVCYGAAA